MDGTDISEMWRNGQRDEARAEARALLESFPAYFEGLHGLDIPTLVGMVDAARAMKLQPEVDRINAYLLAAHEPQRIAGKGR